MQEPKRMSISLPAPVATKLESLSNSQGITEVEAIRRAISTEAFIQEELDAGSRILILNSSGDTKEVLFR